MTALAKFRDTKRYGQEPIPGLHAFKVAAGAVLFGGGMGGTKNGYAVPVSADPTIRVWGRIEAQGSVDNSTGANGEETVEILSGCWKWANGTGADLITQADVGARVYAADDQTVTKTDGGGSRPFAGIVESVDPDGVFVNQGPAFF